MKLSKSTKVEVLEEKEGREVENRVMLVNMPISTPIAGSPVDGSVEHIGLGYIGAYLKSKGIKDVKILDAYSRKLSEENIIEAIKEFNPKFLCLSPTYLSWDLSIRILTRLKDENNGIVTILGGPHVSFEPVLSRALKEHKCIDFIVKGEGEISTYKIIEQTIRGSFFRIPGVCHKELYGKLIIAEDFAKIVEDLDSLPFPLRDTSLLQGKSLRITTSRGCYQNGGGCAFCPTSALYPKGWRGRSAKNVVDEIEFLNDQGFNSFICAEADFLGFSHEGLQRALEIAEEILKRKLKIHLRIFAGIYQILQAEEYSLWENLKIVGLERVFPGIESADLNTLKLFGKPHRPRENYKVINILKKRQIALQMGFIMFNPWSTFESLSENYRFIKDIDQAHLWFNFGNHLLLFPGTKLLEKAKRDGILIKDLTEVGLGEEFAHNYRFINSKIGMAAQSCAALLKNPIIIDIDRMLITAGIILSNYDKDRLPSEMVDLKQTYKKIKKNLSYLNLNTFHKTVVLYKTKSSDRAIKSILKNHLNEVEKRVSGLRSALTRASINVG